jgi:hypothetical protein
MTDLHSATDEELRAELQRRRVGRDTIVTWSGRRHLAANGGRVLNDGSTEAACSPNTFGKRPRTDGVVMWGTKAGRDDATLPTCKKCHAAEVSR